MRVPSGGSHGEATSATAGAAPRLAIVTALLHPRHGGPAGVVEGHVRALSPRVPLQVYGVVSAGDEAEILTALPEARLFARGVPSRWHRGVGLRAQLHRDAHGIDVFHAHMLWDHTVFAAWRAARRAGRALVVTPHGSVAEPWRYRAVHKRVYNAVVLRRLLRETTALHALNADEATALARFGVDRPTWVIGNGVPPEAFDVPSAEAPQALARWPELEKRRLLLYVGRVSREKGLDLLLEAWAASAGEPEAHRWHLVIAGPDEGGHASQLRDRAGRLGVAATVTFTGLVDSTLRRSLTSASAAFALPSHSEGQSLALLEAAAGGLPALYTTGCHFPELQEAGGGWCVEPEVRSLGRGLSLLKSATERELRERGDRARSLVRSEHTLERVAEKLLGMYRQVARR